MIFFFFLLLLSLFTLFSYTFVDGNLSSLSFLYTGFATSDRLVITAVYIFLVTVLTSFYLFFIKRKDTISISSIKKIVIASVIVLVLSYPAMLSYDIFNYMMTSKVAFLYRENPYITMPIEFANDPNLAFTRATNKIALYGPSWVFLTGIPYIMGFQKILVTIFSFKLFIAAFYLGTVYLIWKISKKAFPVLLFALNPLVLIETLISAHNDIVMMFFAILAFYVLQKKRIFLAILVFLISILIKYATLILLPVFLYTNYLVWKKGKVDWGRIYIWSTVSMFIVILAAPLREEIYPWYIIWALSFIVLTVRKTLLLVFTITLSITALFRYVPVLYTGSYFGITPIVRELLTFVPLSFVALFLICKRIFTRKYYR